MHTYSEGTQCWTTVELDKLQLLIATYSRLGLKKSVPRATNPTTETTLLSHAKDLLNRPPRDEVVHLRADKWAREREQCNDANELENGAMTTGAGVIIPSFLVAMATAFN